MLGQKEPCNFDSLDIDRKNLIGQPAEDIKAGLNPFPSPGRGESMQDLLKDFGVGYECLALPYEFV